MLLYQGQLVKNKLKKEPLIYLGHDPGNVNRVMCLKINYKDEREVDWFMPANLEYFTAPSKNPALPGGIQVAFGKYKTKESQVNVLYDKEGTYPYDEYESYLRGMITKYKEKTDK